MNESDVDIKNMLDHSRSPASLLTILLNIYKRVLKLGLGRVR